MLVGPAYVLAHIQIMSPFGSIAVLDYSRSDYLILIYINTI